MHQRRGARGVDQGCSCLREAADIVGRVPPTTYTRRKKRARVTARAFAHPVRPGAQRLPSITPSRPREDWMLHSNTPTSCQEDRINSMIADAIRQVSAGTAAAIQRTAFIRHAELIRAQALMFGGTPDFYSIPAGETRQVFAMIVAMRKAARSAYKIALAKDARAPWLTEAELFDMIRMPFAEHTSGRDLGLLIGMTEEVRQKAKAWHLQSIDGPNPEGRKRRDRERKVAERRASGVKSKFSSERKSKPWELVGMKRTTWQRRGKPTPETHAQHGPKCPRVVSIVE